MEIKDNIFSSNKSGFQNYIEGDEKLTAQKVMNLKNKLRLALNKGDVEIKRIITELDWAGDKDAKRIREAFIDLGVWSVR